MGVCPKLTGGLLLIRYFYPAIFAFIVVQLVVSFVSYRLGNRTYSEGFRDGAVSALVNDSDFIAGIRSEMLSVYREMESANRYVVYKGDTIWRNGGVK